ncbi:transposase, IS4 (plasmid) [Sphingomonas sp. MM-1]|nr:transposase, IS4 [Sphingomonas sp. MM-1]APL96342.1 transposase [Sphingobium indicum B90A]
MGRKRHAMVDTDGRALELLIHAGDVQDRDGAIPLLQQSRHRHPFVSKAFADSAYSAARVINATSISIEIVRKIAGQVGFTVHPRRWVVERTFAWLGRNRRLAKDFEATLSSATAFLYAAAAMVLVRRMARAS